MLTGNKLGKLLLHKNYTFLLVFDRIIFATFTTRYQTALEFRNNATLYKTSYENTFNCFNDLPGMGAIPVFG